METSIQCDCSNDKFWFFGDKVRCAKCYREYKEWAGCGLMYRDFDNDEHCYDAWLKVPEQTKEQK